MSQRIAWILLVVSGLLDVAWAVYRQALYFGVFSFLSPKQQFRLISRTARVNRTSTVKPSNNPFYCLALINALDRSWKDSWQLPCFFWILSRENLFMGEITWRARSDRSMCAYDDSCAV
jgi:hypothetical protein